MVEAQIEDRLATDGTGAPYNIFDGTYTNFNSKEFSGNHMPFCEVENVLDERRNICNPMAIDVDNCEYAVKSIPHNKVKNAICASKLNDLYNQHNFNIKWSPHTHIGKARGYINWDRAVN